MLTNPRDAFRGQPRSPNIVPLHVLGIVSTCAAVTLSLKIIGKEFQKNCYKTIFGKMNTEEFFFQLTLITNKDYFSRKKLFCENLLSRYMWFISMVVTSLVGASTGVWCQLWMLLVNIIYLLVKVSITLYILL